MAMSDSSSSRRSHDILGTQITQDDLHLSVHLCMHAWNCLEVEKSQSPDIMIFQRFRDMYGSLSASNLEDLLFPDSTLTDLIPESEVSSMLKKASQSKMVRDDYQELITLTQLLITKDTSSFSFMKPGAFHKGWWMARILCTIKMVLLQSKINAELPPGAVFDSIGKIKRKSKKSKETQVENLGRLCKFLVAVYVPWWITCGSATDAAENDLLFMGSYRQIDEQIAISAFQAFQRHLWYLTEEMLPLCLYSPHIYDSIKSSIAESMLSSRNGKISREEWGQCLECQYSLKLTSLRYQLWS